MDNLELKQQILSDPANPGEAVLDAIAADPELAAFLEEAQQFDARLTASLEQVTAADNLQAKLLAIATDEEQSASTSVGNVVDISSADTPAETSKPPSKLAIFAIAACLVIAVGALFTPSLFNTGPSNQEIAFGAEVLEHLYLDAETFTVLGSDQQVGFQRVNSVMAPTGGRLTNEALLVEMPIKMAKPCEILPAFQSAHLVVAGLRGAVSVFIINNSPVAQEFAISDERFDGLVIPSEEGNLILVGEKQEDLEQFKQLFSPEVEWVI